MENLYENAEKLTVVGIVAPRDGVAATALAPGFAYLPSLTQHIIARAGETQIVQSQLADSSVDVFSGRGFDEDSGEANGLNFQNMITVDESALQQAFGGGAVPDVESMMQNMMQNMQPGAGVNTAAVQTDLVTALGRLGRGMLLGFIAQNGEGASLTADMADSLASNYLASAEADSDLAGLMASYSLPKDALTQLYQPLLSGLVRGYAASAAQGAPSGEFDVSDLPAGFDLSQLQGMDPAQLAQLYQQYMQSGQGGAAGAVPITSDPVDAVVSVRDADASL